jgi:two-component system response regulator RegX3
MSASTAPPDGHKETILIVEDDEPLARLVGTYLEREGYSVLIATAGDEAIATAQETRPDLVLLDLMLPVHSGLEVCRALRSQSDVPIIMVTARRAEADRLSGFAEGADDYVVKPFSTRELVARVGAVLRRHHHLPMEPVSIGRLSIDMEKREVRVAGETISLRQREFDLLAYLAVHAGKVCSRADLLDHVWGYDFDGDERTINTHVRRLREALGPAGDMLRTVWGVGYRLESEAPVAAAH